MQIYMYVYLCIYIYIYQVHLRSWITPPRPSSAFCSAFVSTNLKRVSVESFFFRSHTWRGQQLTLEKLRSVSLSADVGGSRRPCSRFAASVNRGNPVLVPETLSVWASMSICDVYMNVYERPSVRVCVSLSLKLHNRTHSVSHIRLYAENIKTTGRQKSSAAGRQTPTRK